MTVAFISDLHLDAARPAATQTFIRFLQGPALQLGRLYILGDLFEYWIGDDDPNLHFREVTAALKTYTQQQPRCYFLVGNRDFAIGPAFLREAGLLRLEDPCIIDIHGEQLLISHGDIFCTDDVQYQRYRRFTHHPVALMIYHTLPFAARSRIVDKIRGQSRELKQSKSADIMDVNQQAVETAMREHGMQTLLHGHTHRPDEHDFGLDGKPATRIVLGDWYKDGPVLYWDENGRRTERLTFTEPPATD